MATPTKSYRGGSAPVPNAWSKPSASGRGERSQCRPVMDGSEEAGPRHSKGSCIGLAVGRTSAPCVKPEPLAPQQLPCRCVRLSGAATRVAGVATWRQWFAYSTGEVPPRLGSPSPITGVYKARPKGRPHARVWRRRSPPPPLWGCQQSQSRLALGPIERQNLSSHPVGSRHTGPVSPPVPAIFRLAVASCAATRPPLRNSPYLARTRAGYSPSVWETTAW